MLYGILKFNSICGRFYNYLYVSINIYICDLNFEGG